MSDNYLDKNRDLRKLLIPAIAFYAFSLEVYLKFLLLIFNEINSKKHDISKLYEMLDQNIKFQIENKIGYNHDTFKSNLKIFKNAFIEWRYFYEERDPKIVNLDFVKKMIFAIEEIIQISGYPYPD